MKTWKLSMVEAAAGEQQVFSGPRPCHVVTWDGKDKGGINTAPDGLYTANLTVEYIKGTSQRQVDSVPPGRHPSESRSYP